jgi:hypothetical protein
VFTTILNSSIPNYWASLYFNEIGLIFSSSMHKEMSNLFNYYKSIDNLDSPGGVYCMKQGDFYTPALHDI